MTSRERRTMGTSRLVELHADDGAFDRAFWRGVDPAERMAAVWELVLEDLAWRSPDAPEPRLQRSVCRVERRGG